MSSDQIEAAIIIPDAKPKNNVFVLGDISFLKKKIEDLGYMVKDNGK